MFDYEPHTLLDAGPAGWLLLLALAGAEIIALAALPIAATAARDAPSKLLRGLALAGALLLALGVASAYFVVREAQGWILSPPIPPNGRPAWMSAMLRSEAAHGLVAISLLPIALLAGAAALVRGLRSSTTKTSVQSQKSSALWATRSLTPWLAASVTLLVAACSVGLLRRMHAGTQPQGCAIGILCEVVWFEREAAAILDQTRLQVVAIAALGSLALILIARRSPKPPDNSRRGLTAAALVFGLGLATFLATRAMAHDARAPLPRPESGAERCPSSSCDTAHLPPIGQCRRCRAYPNGGWGPFVELGEDGPRLDLDRIAGPSELAARLAERWGGRRDSGAGNPPTAMFAISPEMPAADFAPYLRAVRDAYRWEIAVVTSQKASHFATKTLGVIPLSARCCCDLVRFSKDGVPLSQIPTWGALAEAAARQGDILYIALP